MKREEVLALLQRQQDYFNDGHTLSVNQRIRFLKDLRSAIDRYEDEICDALKKDLGKSHAESYMCETGLARNELSYMIAHVKKYSRKRTVPTPLSQFASHSYIRPMPYGSVLIMSPWNYPFLLSIDPLADAIAAGNTVVLKPSAYSPYTSDILEKMIRETLPEELATVVTGGRRENSFLLDQKFDLIFFTGSQAVGKEVLRHAAENLTPVRLELGGKSPCIVDHTANIPLAARRIVFGKFLNCGQTCVAPDHILVEESVHDDLIKHLKKEILRQFGNDPLHNENYGKIINEKHFLRIQDLIDPSKVILGGETNPDSQKIAPVLMDNVSDEDAVMKEEIFGPVLPVLTVSSVNEIPKRMQHMAKPLAFYVFSGDRHTIELLHERCRFGGGCVNDCVIHLATPYMGFGGVGESGMGCYHGLEGFRCFSHEESILDKKTWIDMPMRYQPYSSAGEKLVRLFLK